MSTIYIMISNWDSNPQSPTTRAEIIAQQYINRVEIRKQIMYYKTMEVKLMTGHLFI